MNALEMQTAMDQVKADIKAKGGEVNYVSLAYYNFRWNKAGDWDVRIGLKGEEDFSAESSPTAEEAIAKAQAFASNYVEATARLASVLGIPYPTTDEEDGLGAIERRTIMSAAE